MFKRYPDIDNEIAAIQSLITEDHKCKLCGMSAYGHGWNVENGKVIPSCQDAQTDRKGSNRNTEQRSRAEKGMVFHMNMHVQVKMIDDMSTDVLGADV
jgi:ribosome-binding protein aMBF1 (putative translation factor)